MRVLAASLFLFMSTTAWAFSLNPNDVPLFYTIAQQDPKYHDAAFKAQEAFLVQSGFTSTFTKVGDYVAKETTNGVTHVINKVTPFSSKSVFLVVGTAYTMGVKKQITRSFPDPLFPSVTHTISLSRDTQTLGLNVRF